MSKQVDQRVVEMRFDNRDFEKNVKTTMKSLDSLDNSLKFEEATNHLKNVGDSFGTLVKRAMAITIISDITQSLTHSVKSLVDQFSILGTSKVGFGVYEDKMGSVQTIMASTGEDISVVNEKLSELQNYADQTIYSLRDMTNNIGKFTNAGVKLGDAVSAIEGVSNLAAVSGAGAAEASRAMYNFAQALSAGYVKLIDWKSIENANMATVEFKNQLIETAVAEGKLTKTADGMYKTLNGKVIDATHNFNDSLADQWMSTEVLTKTLSNYSNKETEIGKKAYAAATEVKTFTQMINVLKESMQSGWSRTWEIVFGDLNEAKALYSSISEVVGGFFDRQAKARNELLQGWKDLGGRTELLTGLKNVFLALKAIIGPISKAFRDIFPKQTADNLYAITMQFRRFTESLIISEDAGNTIYNVFYKVFGVFKKIFNVVGKIAKFLISTFGNAIRFVASSIKDLINFIKAFVYLLKSSNDEVGKSLKTVHYEHVVKSYIERIKQLPKNIISGLVNGVKSLISKVIKIGKTIGETLLNSVKKVLGIHSPSTKFFEVAKYCILGLVNGIVKVAKHAYEVIKEFGIKMADKFKAAFSKNAEDSQTENKFVSFFKKIWEKIKPVAEAIWGILVKLKNMVVDFFKSNTFDHILEMINKLSLSAILVGVARLFNTSADRAKNVTKIIKSVKEMFDGLTGVFRAVQNQINAQALKEIAKSILILALSLLIISSIEPKQIAEGVKALTILFVELVSAIKIMSKSKGFGRSTAAAMRSVASVAAAVLILAISLKMLSKLNPEKLSQGMSAVTSLMILMTAMALSMSKAKSGMAKGLTAMVFMALGIKILVSSVKTLGKMNPQKLAQGMLAVTVLISEMTGAAILIGRFSKMGKSVYKGLNGLMLMSLGILILSVAVKKLAKMSWPNLIKGIVGVTGLMSVMLGAVFVLSKIKVKQTFTKTVSVLLGMVLSVLILTKVIKKLSKLSWPNLIKGIVGVGLILAALIGAVAALQLVKIGSKGQTTKQIAIIEAIVIAVVALAFVAKKLSEFEWTRLLYGILAMTSFLAVVLGTMAIIHKIKFTSKDVNKLAVVGVIIATLMALVYMFKLIGDVAVGDIGKGALAIVALLAIIAGMIAAVAYAAPLITPVIPVLKGLAIVLLMLAGALALAGVGILAISSAITKLSEVTPDAARTAGTAFNEFVLLLLSKLGEVLDKLIEVVPKFAELIVTIVKEILKKLTDTLPTIYVYVKTLLQDLIRMVGELVPMIIELVVSALVALLKALTDKLPEIIDAAFKLIISFVNGLAEAVRNNKQEIADAAWNLITAFVEALVTFAKTSWEKLKEIGKNIVQGFIEGIKSMFNSVKETVSNLFKKVIGTSEETLDEHSPSKVFKKIGRYVDEGFIDGLNAYSNKVLKSSRNLGETAIDGVKDGLDGMDDLLGSSLDHDPTIRPVLDLSNVEAGAKRIGNLLDSDNVMSISAGITGSSGFGSEVIVNMTINGSEGQDINQLAEIISEKLNDSIRRRESAWQ